MEENPSEQEELILDLMERIAALEQKLEEVVTIAQLLDKHHTKRVGERDSSSFECVN